VTNGLTYSFSVSAVTMIGEGAKSLTSTFWALDVPSAPTVSVTGTSRDSCSVAWAAVAAPTGSQISGYRILIDDGLGGDFIVAFDSSLNPSVFSYLISGLNAQTNYAIKGYVLNQAGNSLNSTSTTCYTATTPGQPGTPQLISSTATTINVQWAPAYDDGGSPIQQYQLYTDLVEGVGAANVENWVL
jgi:hypothetical protein